eukprot:TRINITY_DN7554_c0_g1_i12.p1 TRINITY_DN7554_c0_g1~~TRINITY_DN7554_c0_g1_i12.p1  ORF type:complete len:105 (+),score=4.79 TRINITY_DN7554_c0_g1_i12:103-417(+)
MISSYALESIWIGASVEVGIGEIQWGLAFGDEHSCRSFIDIEFHLFSSIGLCKAWVQVSNFSHEHNMIKLYLLNHNDFPRILSSIGHFLYYIRKNSNFFGISSP